MSMPITLASGSKIRCEILTGAGLKFDAKSPRVDEGAIKQAMLAEEAKPREIADALAEAKAVRVSMAVPGLVIGSDQIMVMDGTIFDKPKNQQEARERLKLMRGRAHNLVGATVICENGKPVWRHLAKTTLTVRDFSDTFLDAYIEAEGDDILTSVGGYKFEGRGAQLFSSVEGDFFSILGLSLLPVLEYLRERGAIAS